MGLEKFLDLLIIRVRKGRGKEVSERKGWRSCLLRCIWEHRDASVLFGRIETVLFPSGSYTLYTMCTQAIVYPVQCKAVSCSFPRVDIQILILKFYSFCSWVVADPSFFPVLFAALYSFGFLNAQCWDQPCAEISPLCWRILSLHSWGLIQSGFCWSTLSDLSALALTVFVTRLKAVSQPIETPVTLYLTIKMQIWWLITWETIRISWMLGWQN